METYRRYKGYEIIRIPAPYALYPWQVWQGTNKIHYFTTRQQARDYINILIKESYGNPPAGIQDTIVTKK